MCQHKMTGFKQIFISMNSKEEIQKLEKIRNDFAHAESLRRCLNLATEATMLHTQFQHYTTFSRAVQILKHRRIWLTRGDSERINDQIEWRKYGPTKQLWKKLFQASFSYGTAEQAFMWYAYGSRDWQSVRLSVSPKGMFCWKKAIAGLRGETVFVMDPNKPDEPGRPDRVVEIEEADIHDILYLAVDDKDRYNQKRNNCAAWDGVVAHFKTLPDDIRAAEMAGWIKDYEWRDECETRILVKTKTIKPKVEFIALPIPDDVLPEMSLTFGPWASIREVEAMKQQLKTALSSGREWKHLPNDFFKQSFLAGALKQWENKQ